VAWNGGHLILIYLIATVAATTDSPTDCRGPYRPPFGRDGLDQGTDIRQPERDRPMARPAPMCGAACSRGMTFNNCAGVLAHLDSGAKG